MDGLILLAPPIVFVIFLLVSSGFSGLTRMISAKGTDSPGKTKAYACGEDIQINRVQPDYTQFFPFAFFFTIMHVVVLIIATVPQGITWLAFVYLLAAVMALIILFKK